MIKWEYHTEEVPDAELVSGILEKRLSKMGEEGWELVTFSMDVSLGANSFAIFKREVGVPAEDYAKHIEELEAEVQEALRKAEVKLPAAPKTAEEPLPKSETTAESKEPPPPPPKPKPSGIRVIVEGKEAPKKKARKEEVVLRKGGVKPKPSTPKSDVKPPSQKRKRKGEEHNRKTE